MKLGDRLQALADFVPQGSRVADIGTDHGYLAVELVKSGKAKFVVASDKNNVLVDFLTTGVYDRNRPFFTTISPSMDILISSNLERLLYHMTEDKAKVASWMQQLQQQGIKRALAYRCFQYRLRRGQRRLLRQTEMLFNPA